ncbi:hypothetical protein AB1L05_14360 [Cytobacillus horneckiae]|uniref:hypothetical protein n=1 Tax=Cytobacillus horneckiae TaxID=549687 RepID=UPI00399F2DF2
MKGFIEEYACGYSMLRESIEGLAEEELRFKPFTRQMEYPPDTHSYSGFPASFNKKVKKSFG